MQVSGKVILNKLWLSSEAGTTCLGFAAACPSAGHSSDERVQPVRLPGGSFYGEFEQSAALGNGRTIGCGCGFGLG